MESNGDGRQGREECVCAGKATNSGVSTFQMQGLHVYHRPHLPVENCLKWLLKSGKIGKFCNRMIQSDLFYTVKYASNTIRRSIRIRRVGQNRIYASYMTVYLVISLPKLPYTHRIYMVLANPTSVPYETSLDKTFTTQDIPACLYAAQDPDHLPPPLPIIHPLLKTMHLPFHIQI
jgi:hypothetical protein